MKIVWAALLCLAPAANASEAPIDDPALARGAHIAQRDCAACHSVTLEGRSPDTSAPTFAQLRLRYNPISLERRLAMFPKFGHEAMPPKSLVADDVADLVAYIQSLDPSTSAP